MKKEADSINQGKSFQCSIPIDRYNKILLAHGSGGRLTDELIKKLFLPAFNSEFLNQQHDGALINLDSKRIAFTTDSLSFSHYFSGGDIGKLAVYGTVNDLSVCGGETFISFSFIIIEEGCM